MQQKFHLPTPAVAEFLLILFRFDRYTAQSKNYAFSKSRAMRAFDEIGTSVRAAWEGSCIGKGSNNADQRYVRGIKMGKSGQMAALALTIAWEIINFNHD